MVTCTISDSCFLTHKIIVDLLLDGVNLDKFLLLTIDLTEQLVLLKVETQLLLFI